MYSDKVLDHFHHPRNVGEIPDATEVIEASNPVCGDLMKLWVKVREGRIEDVKFKVAGCIPAVACGSWLAETLKGKPLSLIGLITPKDVESALGGLPPASHHAAVLAADALIRLFQKLK